MWLKHRISFLLVLAPLAAIGQTLDIDHVWIRVDPNLDVRTLFESHGFLMPEGPDAASGNGSSGFFIHTGQGTASTFVRFRNIYLELIRLEDRELLTSVAPEHGYTLLHESETSPFGIGLKQAGANDGTFPFPTSSHWAPWMRPLVSLATARREIEWPGDPAVFVIPDYLRWDLRIAADPELLIQTEHEVDLGEVTRIKIYGPQLPSGSEVMRFIGQLNLIEFLRADDTLMELEFGDRRDGVIDFRPELPLVMRH